MSKRFLSFLLAALLVVSVGSESALAVTLPAQAQKEQVRYDGVEDDLSADKSVNLETTTGDLEEEAVSISDNEIAHVTISENSFYKVFKFVPDETKQYYFFSCDKSTDPYVYLYEKSEDSPEDYVFVARNDDEEESTNFYLSCELTAGKEYYYIASTFDEDYGEYNVILSSLYTSKEEYEERIFEGKGIASISFKDVPKYEWYEYEDTSRIPAGLNLSALSCHITFTDGTTYDKQVGRNYSYTYDVSGNAVGSQFFVSDKLYKVYWEQIRFESYYDEDMDEGYGVWLLDTRKEDNALCIEVDGNIIARYTVNTKKENPVEKIEVGNNPFEKDRTLYTEDDDSLYSSFVQSKLSELSIEVTYKDEGKTVTITPQDDAWGEVSIGLKDIYEDGITYKLGDNHLVITYFGHSIEIPVNVVTDARMEVITPIKCVVYDKYPYMSVYSDDLTDDLSLKGLKVRLHYTDGSSEEIEVKENNSDFSNSKGKYYYLVASSDGEILVNGIVVGTFVFGKKMNSIQGIKAITPGVPVNVSVNEEHPYAYFAFTPDETREYKFYSSNNKYETYDEDDPYDEYDPYGYICTNDSLVCKNDDWDDDSLNFSMTQKLNAGETYYFVASKWEDSNSASYTCNLEAVTQLNQTIKAPATINKKVGDAPFAIGATAYGKVKMSYASSNPAVAVIDANGKVTIKGEGTTTITVTTAESNEYKAGSKKITLTVSKVIPVLTIQAKSSYSKAFGSKAFNLSAKSEGTLTYKSSNSKVATVNKSGKVTLKNCGKAVITVTAKKTGYTTATKKITIKVVPKTAKVTSVKSNKSGEITVEWKKQSEAKGYIIEYSTDKKFKKNVNTVKVNKKTTTSKTIKKLKKGKKYYVRVKAYVTIDKKAATGTASKAKSIRVKK